METFDLAQEYNGYTNFPTWMIALMLDNERECYDKIMAYCDWLNGIPDMTHKQRVHQLARKIEDYFNHLPHGVVDFKWWIIWKGDFEYHGILKAIYGKNPILVDWEQIASENFGEFLIHYSNLATHCIAETIEQYPVTRYKLSVYAQKIGDEYANLQWNDGAKKREQCLVNFEKKIWLFFAQMNLGAEWRIELLNKLSVNKTSLREMNKREIALLFSDTLFKNWVISDKERDE